MSGRVLLAWSMWVLVTAGRVGAQCAQEWDPAFGPRGIQSGGSVNALYPYVDRDNAALVVGGDFYYAGRANSRSVVKWDGRNWEHFGYDYNNDATTFTMFDDGDGARLYAGLRTWPNVIRRDGTNWEAVTANLAGQVSALAVFDDGSGLALYAGGAFKLDGDSRKRCIAKWSGKEWSLVGGGLSHYDYEPNVRSLAVFDDGNGPVLYVGGHFTRAGQEDGVDVWNIARWDGKNWAAIDYGVIGGFNDGVFAMTVWDDGNGAALFAGGEFDYAGPNEAKNIARWDGASWKSLGAGVLNDVGHGEVDALQGFDWDDGPRLVVGGEFSRAGELEAGNLALWDGSGWTAGQKLNGAVRALTLWGDDGDPAIYVGGEFSVADDVGAMGIIAWDGQQFHALGNGDGMNDHVIAFSAYDAGNGPTLHAAGGFQSSGSTVTHGIARWDGRDWQTVGGGFSGLGDALHAFDDGSGQALYAGGQFASAGGVEAINVARWDGTSWTALAGGLGEPDSVNGVFGFGEFDSGHGTELYAGGNFRNSGDVELNHIARWNGSEWLDVGGGIKNDTWGEMYAWVLTIAVFDDGDGPALYVGGLFDHVGDVRTGSIAKWDGQHWSEVGGGLSNDRGAAAIADVLCVFDDGSGPALYVGGEFALAGSLPADGMARWDGRSWSNVGGWQAKKKNSEGASVFSLTAWDDGDGAKLYAGAPRLPKIGDFQKSGIVCWDGRRWSNFQGASSPGAWSMYSFDSGDGPALWVGGDFDAAGGRPSSRIARWGPPRHGDMNCDGGVDMADVEAFVAALIDRDWYESEIPDCVFAHADMNCDGVVTFDDIDGFVECLVKGGCP